jgi:hypothetical protein
MHDDAPAYFSCGVRDALNGQVKKAPLHGLHAHLTWILWIFTCEDT